MNTVATKFLAYGYILNQLCFKGKQPPLTELAYTSIYLFKNLVWKAVEAEYFSLVAGYLQTMECQQANGSNLAVFQHKKRVIATRYVIW